MSDHLSSVWHSRSYEATTVSVIPDGCRDLIMKVVNQARPHWYVTPLFDNTKTVSVDENSILLGFRLKPGVEIGKRALLKYVQNERIHADEVQDALSDFTHLDPSIEEALGCLASDISSIKQASNMLGVSTRSLQRLVVKKTERSPSYWFQLARARKAARHISSSSNFAEVADQCGYADQSHMNRALRHWFNMTPSEISKSPITRAQLNDSGYG